MSITLSTEKELNAAVKRIRTTCDELGIRLGKEDAKAQKLICSVLNVPNWHVALSKVSVTSEPSLMLQEQDNSLLLTMSDIKEISNSVYSLEYFDKLDPASFVVSVCREIQGLKNPLEFIQTLNSTLRYMDTIVSRLVTSDTAASDELKYNAKAMAVLVSSVLRKAGGTMSDVDNGLAKAIVERLKTYTHSNNEQTKVSSRYIDCPDCGNHDSDDEYGFTYPNYEGHDFVVCQNCGRRTADEDWNNPYATTLGMPEYDGISRLRVGAVNEINSKLSKGTQNPLSDLTDIQLFNKAAASGAVGESVLKLMQRVMQRQFGDNFSPSETLTEKVTPPVLGEVIFLQSHLWTVSEEGSEKDTFKLTNAFEPGPFGSITDFSCNDVNHVVLGKVLIK